MRGKKTDGADGRPPTKEMRGDWSSLNAVAVVAAQISNGAASDETKAVQLSARYFLSSYFRAAAEALPPPPAEPTEPGE